MAYTDLQVFADGVTEWAWKLMSLQVKFVWFSHQFSCTYGVNDPLMNNNNLLPVPFSWKFGAPSYCLVPNNREVRAAGKVLGNSHSGVQVKYNMPPTTWRKPYYNNRYNKICNIKPHHKPSVYRSYKNVTHKKKKKHTHTLCRWGTEAWCREGAVCTRVAVL